MLLSSKCFFDVILNTEHNQQLKMSIDAYVLDYETPMDLILGRETIKHNNLVFHFPSHFTKVHTTTTLGDGGSEESDTSRTGDLCAVRYPRVVTAMHYRKLSDDSHSINSYSDSINSRGCSLSRQSNVGNDNRSE